LVSVPDVVAELRALNSRIDLLNSRIDLLDYHSHGARAVYVGNNRVLMKAVVANALIAFFLEADDRLLTPWFIVSGRYETELTDFFLKNLKPDSYCIDIGANFGYYTCLMSRFCPSGRVIAVEADEHVYELARDNIFINGFEHIAQAIHGAASDSGEWLTLYRRLSRSANTSLAKMSDDFVAQMGELPSQPFEVKGIRIDDLLPRLNHHVDFIKIDVEGAEPLAFRGARETIERNPRLTIVMEWSPHQISGAGFDPGEFLSELESMHLQPFNTEGKALSRDELLATSYFAGIVLRRSWS